LDTYYTSSLACISGPVSQIPEQLLAYIRLPGRLFIVLFFRFSNWFFDWKQK